MSDVKAFVNATRAADDDADGELVKRIRAAIEVSVLGLHLSESCNLIIGGHSNREIWLGVSIDSPTSGKDRLIKVGTGLQAVMDSVQAPVTVGFLVRTIWPQRRGSTSAYVFRAPKAGAKRVK